MIPEIPDFLKQQFLLSKSYANKFPDYIKEFIILYASYYKWDPSLKLQTMFNLIKIGTTYLPCCVIDGCTNPVTIKATKPYFSKGCCMVHNLQASMLEKYGVDNIMYSDIGLKKFESTMLERYGVTNPKQVEQFNIKMKNTMLEKYNTPSFLTSLNFKEIKKNKMIERYGVEHAMQSKKLREQYRKTSLKKFGYIHHMKTKLSVEKLKNTMISKYGVDHVMHIPESHETVQKKIYKKKEYVWSTGEISNVQGYEHIILKELENNGYSYTDIVTSKKDMPIIWYQYNDKKHRYYPDIFIPKENLIIEVKSSYTMEINKEINLLKANACKLLGYSFKFEIR